MSNVQVISPKFEVVPMHNWDLKDLKTTFIIPEYERRVDRNHLKSMVEAILKNEFYDIVLRGVKRQDGKIEIIDAQHRLQAFITAHDQHGLKKYSFVLVLYDSSIKRKIYRKLNQGKRLVSADHTLAMDDGKIKFFTELKDYCYHYRNTQRLSFVEVLGLWHYCSTKKHVFKQSNMEEAAKSIPATGIEFCKRFMKVMSSSAGVISGNPLYMAGFFRNIGRVSFENDLSESAIAALILKVQRSKIPESFIKTKSHIVMGEIYTWLNSLLEKKKK